MLISFLENRSVCSVSETLEDISLKVMGYIMGCGQRFRLTNREVVRVSLIAGWNMEWNGGMENGKEQRYTNSCNLHCSSRLS